MVSKSLLSIFLLGLGLVALSDGQQTIISSLFGRRKNPDPTVTVTGAGSLLTKITETLEQINTNLKANSKTGDCNCPSKPNPNPSKGCDCQKDANLVYFEPRNEFFDALLPLYQKNGRVEFAEIGAALKQLATSTDQDKASIRKELDIILKRIGNIKIQIKTMEMLFKECKHENCQKELAVWSRMTKDLDAITNNINEALKKLDDATYQTKDIQAFVKATGQSVQGLLTTFGIPPPSTNPTA